MKTIEQLIAQNKIGYISLPNAEIEFFGYMLLEYMLDHITEPVKQAKKPQSTNQERILRLEDKSPKWLALVARYCGVWSEKGSFLREYRSAAEA